MLKQPARTFAAIQQRVRACVRSVYYAQAGLLPPVLGQGSRGESGGTKEALKPILYGPCLLDTEKESLLCVV